MEGKIMESCTSKSTVMRNISEIFEALIIVALLLAGIVTAFFLATNGFGYGWGSALGVSIFIAWIYIILAIGPLAMFFHLIHILEEINEKMPASTKSDDDK